MLSTAPSSQPVSDFYAPVLDALEGVKASLLRIVPPESELLAQTLHHSLSSGGKYLRPAITLLAGLANGHQILPKDDPLIEVACVSEMIHIATLLHDDVLDQADLRRKKKTVRALWGNTVSVLSGDYLLAQASLKLANVGNIRIVSIYSHVLADLCDGEVEQIRTSYQLETPWDSYYRKTICKTASLFAAGCEAAGVLTGLPEEQIQQLRAYGNNFGIAFQILDDLLDYTSSEQELGKPVLDDLRNGLLNAPILLILKSDQVSEAEKQAISEQVQAIFNAADEQQSRQVAEALKKRLYDLGAVDQTLALAAQYGEAAEAALSFVPDSVAKTSLLGLLHANLKRRN
jgi:geranylgeranyl pyrophosphate synthase